MILCATQLVQNAIMLKIFFGIQCFWETFVVQNVFFLLAMVAMLRNQIQIHLP